MKPILTLSSPLHPTRRSARLPRSAAAAAVLVLAAGLLAGCGPDDPAEQVEAARARYEAEAVSFSVDQTPRGPAQEPAAAPGETAPAPDEAAGEEPATERPPGDEAAGDAALDGAEAADLEQDAILDILLRFNGTDPLPGITVDVTHADAAGNDKRVHLVYLDTSNVHRGTPTQIVHRLEDVPYEEGDGFHATVRSPIPPAERDLYREFAEAGEGRE